MITVKVTFSDGDHLITGINTDLEGARRYYLGDGSGKIFNVGRGEHDHLVRAVSVEQIGGVA